MTDEQMWSVGIVPEWLRRELAPLMRPMVLPKWLGGPSVAAEEWRKFREGTYEVSSHGNIRRVLDRERVKSALAQHKGIDTRWRLLECVGNVSCQ